MHYGASFCWLMALSLIPLAQRAKKPVFALRAADGALGSHAVAAKASWAEFAALARKIEEACGLSSPGPSQP